MSTGDQCDTLGKSILTRSKGDQSATLRMDVRAKHLERRWAGPMGHLMIPSPLLAGQTEALGGKG